MIDMQILLFIALILFSTKVLAIFIKRIHLPQVVGALVAGVLLGPAVFNLIAPNATISVLAQLGIILLLFSAGMETDFKQLRDSLKHSLLISVLGIVASLGGGFVVAFLSGKPSFESFFIGVVIAAMSTSITVETLQEMGKIKTKAGTALLGAALFDDVIVVCILAVAMDMGVSGFSFGDLGIILLKLVLFFAFALVAGLGVNKLFNFMYNRFGRKRRLTIFAIAYCFLMAYLAELFGLADVAGAYIAGIAFCSTRCAEYLGTRAHELSYMFFTPIFLANIGLHTSFEGMDGSLVLFTVLLVVVAVFSKFGGCGLGAKISKYSNRESAQVGAGMIARGEISFIVAAKGIEVGLLSSLMFPSIIVVVLVTAFATPLLLEAAFAEKKLAT